MYIQDSTGTVSAIDRDTGAVRWQAKQRDVLVGPNGVAVGWGMVFANDGSSGVIALDAETGEVRWRRALNITPSEGIDIQPTVFGKRVLVSTVPISLRGIYQGGDRGIVHALDIATGKDAWTFDTIQSPDLWGHPDVNSGGGAWYPPAIDPTRGLVYWGVANPAPFPGTAEFPNGSSRPGPNLYTESVVTLSLRSGIAALVPPADSARHLRPRPDPHTPGRRARPWPSPPHARRDGQAGPRRGSPPAHRSTALEHAGRHAHERRAHGARRTDRRLARHVRRRPHPAGRGRRDVYVATLNAPTMLSPDSPAYFGSRLGTMDGDVVAIDAATGRIKWDTKVPGDPTGAATVVNDLVITATFDGQLFGLDRGTGAIVWRYQAPGGINGFPAVAGDLMLVPVGMADTPRLLALRVGPPGASTTTLPVSTTTTTNPDVVSLAQHVQPIFDRRCVACHQGARPPDLRPGFSYAELVNVSGLQCVARKLVVPGSPADSYLIDKLRGPGSGCFEGSIMPPGAPLTTAQRNLIANWIRQGALDN